MRISGEEHDRRRFLGVAARTTATISLGLTRGTAVLAGERGRVAARHARPQSARSYQQIKQIEAGLLSIGYAEVGASDGPVVVLLHGWPYDIHSYAEVAPLLASAGYRVIVPYLRGYGATRFLSAETVRNAQQSAVAMDIVALVDALQIRQAIFAGFDWGTRTVDIVAALWPERCRGIVAVSGYLIANVEANRAPLPPQTEHRWWYQYYFATERGRLGYAANRRAFNRLIWKNGSPKWQFDEATYDRTARAFDNPDHVSIVIHNYRWRLGLAAGEPQYDELERRLARTPNISVPAITIGSDFDGPAADGAAYAGKFVGPHAHRIFDGVGHNVPQEAPAAFAKAVIDVDRLGRQAASSRP
jgi:pimeloyl-ACP methyl ester carboxylesterase